MSYGSFDATNITPQQGFDTHPLGIHPSVVANTQIVPNKDQTGGMFRVTFQSASGSIDKNYNIWNQNEKAKEIAGKELAALCHATGVFRLNFDNMGAELRGARCQIEVAPQKDPNPNGYVEVKRVLDQNGNEPGKPTGQAPQGQQGQWGNAQQPQQPNPPQPQQQPQAPMQQQPNGGGWTAPNPPQAQPPQGQQPAWGQGGQAPQQPQQQPNPPVQQASGGAPPWATGGR